MEFALAWPIVLLLVLGTAEIAVWTGEAMAARDAALAGARAGTVAGATAEVAAAVTLRALAGSLVGASATVWCPAGTRPAPALWVCARDLGSAVEVEVGGSVPSLVPLVPARGLPLRAHVILDKESFVR